MRLPSLTRRPPQQGAWMNDELQGLKNLGKTSAQWLHAVGIHNESDLRRLGAVVAYQAVKTRGFRASKALLYALEGALLDIHWNELPADHKRALDQRLLAEPAPGKSEK
jgi:DNA transformation protein